CKGKRKGNVGIYDHHALIVVNYGTENGEEILSFIQDVQYEVQLKFNIELEPEVWIY
ncbi:MAG TPA: UDP-N-acetylmuramate dehydrogenase, partial [Petrimonas sp.]|nr:UDP-N-acetylmuramate dehydrogenase [Petrimonas sp.]